MSFKISFKMTCVICHFTSFYISDVKCPYKKQQETSKRERLVHQMMHGETIWKRGGLEPLTVAPSPQPIAIKLNPLWKTEVRKSAWIKPWCESSPNLAICNSDTTVCSSEILVSWYDNVISNYYFIAVGKLAHKVLNIDEWFNNWIFYITLFYFIADCEQVFHVLNFYYSL